MNYNSNISFETKETWDNYDKGGVAKELRVPVILNSIPADVKTIVDIGCGNGLITNELAKKYDVVGVDISEEALRKVHARTIRSSCTNIEEKSNSYDLVLSSQMLEHLSDKDLSASISEIIRLTKKYVLITVPNNENLNQSAIKCPVCNKLFHVVGHLQTFTGKDIVRLFGGSFKLLNMTEFGRKARSYNPMLLKLRHKYAKQYYSPPEHTVCPFCSNANFEKAKKTFLSKALNGLNLIFGKRQPYWVLVLLQKNDSE